MSLLSSYLIIPPLLICSVPPLHFFPLTSLCLLSVNSFCLFCFFFFGPTCRRLCVPSHRCFSPSLTLHASSLYPSGVMPDRSGGRSRDKSMCKRNAVSQRRLRCSRICTFRGVGVPWGVHRNLTWQEGETRARPQPVVHGLGNARNKTPDNTTQRGRNWTRRGRPDQMSRSGPLRALCVGTQCVTQGFCLPVSRGGEGGKEKGHKRRSREGGEGGRAHTQGGGWRADDSSLYWSQYPVTSLLSAQRLSSGAGRDPSWYVARERPQLTNERASVCEAPQR